LQPVAELLCPAVGESIAWLAGKGLHARMTGSGSAVFAQLPPDCKVDGAPSNMALRVCSSLEAHPLQGWC